MEVREFRAMGSRCRIAIDGGSAALADRAVGLVDALEMRWSRFLPDSEISRVNAAPGHLHLVSPETYRLVEAAERARQLTEGVFNPLMLEQLEQIGYRRTWVDGPLEPLGMPEVASLEEIEMFPDLNALRLPPGTRFDPGGIGKGFTVDVVTEMIASEGVAGAFVELGGDLRVVGTPWYGPAWRVAVAHPLDDDREIGAFTPEQGAVCTSSRLKRRWQAGAREFHHLLDPRTGEPAVTDLVSVSACSSTAAWAEVAAKVVLIKGSADAVATFGALNVSGMAVTAEGVVLTTSSLAADDAGPEAGRDLEGTFR